MSAELSVRARAAQLIARVLQEGASLGDLLAEPQHRERALLLELCYGVCRFAQRYQVILEHFLDKPLKARDSDIRALLYLGFYQLQHTRIPDHAALAATVEATRELDKGWAKGLINAVLRNFQRLEQTPESWQRDSRYLYSHPKWLYLACKKAWPDSWQAALNANNQRGPMTLRINRQQVTREDYAQRLEQLGLPARATAHSCVGLQLDQACDVEQLPDFATGAVSVQDEAAQLAAALLDLQAGQRVLDACCAPGGKTCHILEHCPEIGELVAVDLEAARLQRVQANLQRLQLQATLRAGDAAQPQTWWDGTPFERILLDAPCSATGVIRRHPDIKLLRRDSDIGKLAQLQLALLTALWPLLRPGGLLVYATCSLLPEENEQVIARFVETAAQVEHLPIAAQWGIARPWGRQLLPQTHGHDGFYYALLRKTSTSS